MRPENKKEKTGLYNSPPLENGLANSSQRQRNGVSNTFSSLKQEMKPSYNAVPPPRSLYSSPTSPAISILSHADNAQFIGPGNSERDSEKKGRRRPCRKSRQVADSSSFFVNSESSLQSGGYAGSIKVDQSPLNSQKMAMSSTQLPSPSPSSMPSPSFKIKASQLPSSPLSLRSSPKPDKSFLDMSIDSSLVTVDVQSDQSNASSNSSLSSGSLIASAQVDAEGPLRRRLKESPPIGIPKSKAKELGKSPKASSFLGSRKSTAVTTEFNKQVISQKGWRMCAPSGNAPSCLGALDAPSSPRRATHSELYVESSPPRRHADQGVLQNPHSWPGSSVLGMPSAACINGSNGTAMVHSGSRSRFFSEHLSLEDAHNAIQEGLALKGILRVNAHYRSEAYVTLEGVPLDILIDGLCAQNRAIENDVVAVQLNPTSQWPRLKGCNNKQSSSFLTDDSPATGMLLSKVNARNELDYCEPSEFVSACNQQAKPADVFVECSSVESQVVNDWQCVQFSPRMSSSKTENGVGKNLYIDEKIAGKDFYLSGSQPSAEEFEASTRVWPELHGEESSSASWSNGTGIRNDAVASRSHLAAIVASMPGKRPTGRVVAILERSVKREAVIGFLESQGNGCGGRGAGNPGELSPQKPGRKVTRNVVGYVIFVPVDNRFPRMVVFGSSLPECLARRIRDGDPTVNTELVVARIEGWKSDSALPRAVIKQSLGLGGTIEAQTAAILFENAIHSEDFPPSSLSCLPELPWRIPEQEEQKRRDLRTARIFSIDPLTARDLDDALSIQDLDNGYFQVGVHIADVSFFVQPDTALDKEAQSRSTSVYLIQKVLPMLPPLLCEQLCSLNPGVDRLTLSVIWTMDSEGNVLDQWIGRTIICSCAKLTYGHTQQMIDDKFTIMNEKDGEPTQDPVPQLHGAHCWEDVTADVIALHKIAKKRRENRFDGGALRLENSKLTFSLDDDGKPYDSMIYQHQESNFLVEEFMLLANMTVARVISAAFPQQALLRRHPEPNSRKLKEFEEFCMKTGFALDVSSSGALHLSLEKMRETVKDDPVLYSILMAYATKPMQLAKYFCTGEFKDQEDYWAHYALAVPLYTHFTSPIRRYPDLVVHRTLIAVLEAEEALSDSRRRSKKSGLCQCFSGHKVDKDISRLEFLQKALVVAARKYKIPSSTDLALVAAHCNERKQASRNVREASDKLYLWTMVKKKQRLLSDSRVLALGPKFMSLYLSKIGMERRIYYDEIEGLNAEWFEATGTLVLNLSTERVSPKKSGQVKGRPQRTVADVALLVNPTDTISADMEKESFEDIIREVEERLAGKIISEDDGNIALDKGVGSDVEVEPAVLPLTLRWFSAVPVSIHAIGGESKPLDIAVRLYVSSYAT